MPPADTLSPSTAHRRLLRAVHQRQAWNGQPLGPWARKLRRTVRELSGLTAMDRQRRPPLRVKRLWRGEHELGTIEKIRFRCEPGSDATAFLCLPRGLAGKQPWMICLQGHSTGAHVSVGLDRDDHERLFAVEGDRDFGVQCLRLGIPALCLEQRCFGDRREQAMEQPCGHNGCHDGSMQALMLGRTMIAERVYDVDRAIDYLWTRDDVDRRRVGVMGNSGGGTTSLFAAAALRRISFAMPSCYFCSLFDCLGSIYHCGCNYVPRLFLEADMAEVLGTFAPKPVVVVAGKEDPIFPLPGVRRAFRQLKRIYAAADAADRCKLVVGNEGHRFYADEAWPVALPLLRG